MTKVFWGSLIRIEYWTLIILSILIIGILIYQGVTKEDECSSSKPCVIQSKVYEGPVPEWADEKIFRETGKTVRRT